MSLDPDSIILSPFENRIDNIQDIKINNQKEIIYEFDGVSCPIGKFEGNRIKCFPLSFSSGKLQSDPNKKCFYLDENEKGIEYLKERAKVAGTLDTITSNLSQYSYLSDIVIFTSKDNEIWMNYEDENGVKQKYTIKNTSSVRDCIDLNKKNKEKRENKKLIKSLIQKATSEIKKISSKLAVEDGVIKWRKSSWGELHAIAKIEEGQKDGKFGINFSTYNNYSIIPNTKVAGKYYLKLEKEEKGFFDPLDHNDIVNLENAIKKRAHIVKKFLNLKDQIEKKELRKVESISFNIDSGKINVEYVDPYSPKKNTVSIDFKNNATVDEIIREVEKLVIIKIPKKKIEIVDINEDNRSDFEEGTKVISREFSADLGLSISPGFYAQESNKGDLLFIDKTTGKVEYELKASAEKDERSKKIRELIVYKILIKADRKDIIGDGLDTIVSFGKKKQ